MLAIYARMAKVEAEERMVINLTNSTGKDRYKRRGQFKYFKVNRIAIEVHIYLQE